MGNLRTGLLAWCFATSADNPDDSSRFLVRMEDLSTEAIGDFSDEQMADIDSLGITYEPSVVRQSNRTELYDAAISKLTSDEATYQCFCSRREIAEAVAAPHGEHGHNAYPGTCSGYDSETQSRMFAEKGRSALRVRAGAAEIDFEDRIHGVISGVVDDFVLRRWDGVASYNLAVVVDDSDQGVDQVTRGDDLLPTTNRHVFLQQMLGLDVPEYIHVPLVVGPDGERLQKRHGAQSMRDLRDMGIGAETVISALAGSFGLPPEPDQSAALIRQLLSPETLNPDPWVFDSAALLAQSRTDHD